MCQTPERVGTGDKESSLSRYVAVCAKPYLENRRRGPFSVGGLKDAKAYVSTKEDSSKA